MTEVPPTQPGPPAAGGRTPRWLKLTLVASLAVNLLLVGLIVGAALRRPDDGAIRGPSDELRDMARALPPRQRAALAAEIRRRRDDFHQRRDELEAHRHELAEALAADPYDPEAVAAQLKSIDAFWREIGAEGRAMMTARIEAMTSEERAAFAKAIQAPPHPDRHGPRSRRDD